MKKSLTEKVARALALAEFKDPGYADDNWNVLVPDAKAAIRAVRKHDRDKAQRNSKSEYQKYVDDVKKTVARRPDWKKGG